jgi:hypothetical protein
MSASLGAEREGHAPRLACKELCERDCATILKHPTGVRILYDARQSVTGAGAGDPRLGDVRVIVLSHAHGDRLGNRMGDRRMGAQDAGTCAAPETVSAAPNSSAAEIAAAKDSAVVMLIPMTSFIGNKIENVKVKLKGPCPATGLAALSWRRCQRLASWGLGASGGRAKAAVLRPRCHVDASRRAAKLAARRGPPTQSRRAAISGTSRAWANPPSSADRRARTCVAPAR